MPMIDCKSIAKGILVDVADKVKTMEVKPTLYMTSFNGDGDALAKGLAKDCERVGISFKHSSYGNVDTLGNKSANITPVPGGVGLVTRAIMVEKAVGV